jgi:hypothetical protein
VRHKKQRWLIMIGSNSLPVPPLTREVFDNVIGFFRDSSGQCSHATSLTLSDAFNPFRHPPACGIRPIDYSIFAADSSFDFQRRIAANSSLSLRLPPSRCDGPKPTSPGLPPDR